MPKMNAVLKAFFLLVIVVLGFARRRDARVDRLARHQRERHRVRSKPPWHARCDGWPSRARTVTGKIR